MSYKVLKRWYLSDGESPAEMGWKILGRFSCIRKAREAMHHDVRAVEAANEYRSPYYGGEDDTQKSRRLSRDNHLYDMADSNGSHVEWEIVRGGLFTRPLFHAL